MPRIKFESIILPIDHYLITSNFVRFKISPVWVVKG